MRYIMNCLENYATFDGRARRKEFWYFYLFCFVGGFFLPALHPAIYWIFLLGTLLPSLAVGARRCHDVGKNGWFQLIPIYNIVLFCTDSETSENKYGPKIKWKESVSVPYVVWNLVIYAIILPHILILLFCLGFFKNCSINKQTYTATPRLSCGF